MIHRIRFQSALGVLVLATGLLAGCSDSDGSPQGDDSSEASGSGGTGAGKGGKDGKDGGDAGSLGKGDKEDDKGKGDDKGEPGRGTLDTNRGEYRVSDFSYREDRRKDFHPLDARETVLLRREEVAIVAVDNSGSPTGITLDDAEHAFADLGVSAAEELQGMTIFDVKPGNVDNDGNDEMIAVGVNQNSLVVRVVDSDKMGVFDKQAGFTRLGDGYLHAWVEVGDLDNDGRAEILVPAVTSEGVELRLYDDATKDFAELKELINEPGEEIAAAIGNFDDDRGLEIAVLIDRGQDLELRVLDDAENDFAPILTRQNEELGLFKTPFVVTGLRIVSGDFDANKQDPKTRERVGDARDELALFVMGYFQNADDGEGGIRGIVLDDARADFAKFSESFVDVEQAHPSSGYRLTNDWGWQVMATDANGDDQDELYLLSRVAGDVAFDWRVTQMVYGNEVERWARGTTAVTLTGESGTGQGEVNGSSPAFMTAAAGRSDRLGRDVIVTLVDDEGDLKPYRLTAEVRPGDAVYTLSDEALPTRSLPGTRNVFVAGGDWDADSLRIRYTGSKWLELSRPQPIAILAAPPAKEGISQNYAIMGTAYGTAVSNGTSTTQEYGVTNSLTFSFEASVPVLDFISVSAQHEFERQFTNSQTSTEVVTYGTSYASGYPYDVVVFNGALCMRYEYEILSGGDPAYVGTTMTIDEPVDARIYKWTVDYYNDSLGAEASPIGKDILTHTVGDPASYPTRTVRDSLMAGHQSAWKSPKAVSVGQGTGSTDVTIDISKEKTSTAALTLSTEYGGGIAAFLGASYTEGWNSSSAYSVTVGEQTSFRGTVGDIASRDDYKNWFYSYGLFVYPATLKGGEKVHVIQYWTEGLSDNYKK